MIAVRMLFRRATVLLLLTACLVLGAALPSWASFIDAVALPQATVSTPNVAVTGLTATATCANGTATLSVSWNPSAAPRITGYHVVLWLGAAYQDIGIISTPSWTGRTSTTYVTGYVMTFTVETVTPYGWNGTTQSARVVCS